MGNDLINQISDSGVLRVDKTNALTRLNVINATANSPNCKQLNMYPATQINMKRCQCV